MKQARKIIQKIGAENGLKLGFSMILLYALMYWYSLDLFLEWWVTFVKLLLVVGFCLWAIIKSKRRFSQLSFQDAFTAFFVCILVGTFMFTLFNFVVFHEIDPEAGKYIGRQSIDQLEKQTSGGGEVPEEFKQQLTEMRAEDQYGFFYQLKGFVFNLAGYSIIGVLLALIFRTKILKKK